MTTSQALIVYIVIVIFVFAILIHMRIKPWSALIITLLVGQILLNILCPPSQVSPLSSGSEIISSSAAIYIVIQIVTPLLAILYIFVMGWNDRYMMVPLQIP